MSRVGAIPHVDGLTVEQAMCRMGERAEVCPVCHRGVLACICKSHVDVKARVISDESDGLRCLDGRRPYTKAQVDLLVSEGLALYYNRDAEGLQRFLRRVIP